MADLKDLASRYGLEDYEQLLGGYPNAEKFLTGLKDAAVRSVPTTEQMRDPNFIIDTAGLGGAIKAYHGTPHLFDRFDMSKIGTGEGAQAYGHGLYFAQEPSIAESYRKNLSAKDIAINDKKSDLITDMLDKSVLDHITTYGNKNAALDALNEKINYGSQFDDIDWLKNVKNKLELSKIEQPSGNIYETSIRWPNAEREAMDPLGEHHLLDWDQPLSEQSDYVRNKLKKSDFYKNANKAYKDQKQWYLDPSQKTGESFLKYMRSGYDDEFASAIKDAEQYLKNLDIPGLKYLDATSRSTDKGTRNYVMFGDEYPEIIKRAGSLDELANKYNELHPDKNYVSWDVTSDSYLNAEGDEVLGDPYALIEKVYTHPEDRNKGVATRLMSDAMKEIESKHPNMPIKLSPIPLDKDTDTERLMDFYRKFGFDEMPEGHMQKYAQGGAVDSAMSDYEQLLSGYPNATKFFDALQSGIESHIPTTEDLRSPQRMGEWSLAAALNQPTGLTFIGKNARNWDAQAAKLAEEKLNAGADPAEVWREHLIGRMPDKTLFSEISDKDANLLTPRNIEEKIAYQKTLAEGMKAGIKERNASLKVQPDLFEKDIKAYNKQKKADADLMLNEINRNFGLQDYLPKYEGVEAGQGTFSKNVYTHPELFENYPKLGESVTRFGGQSDKFHGSFTPSMSGGNIEIYYPSVEAGTKNSVMAHELQHAIQESERWGRGGNESMIRRNPLDYTSNETIEYAKSLPRYQEMDNDADRKAFIESFAKMRLGSPFEAYRKLTGEAQARATQDRLDMDMAQRRENYPLAGGKLSDIPLKDLIYKYASDGPSLSMDPLSKYKDYVGEHSAPLGDSGAPLHDLTANENAIYPSDVYSSQANQYYGTGEPEDAQLFAMAQRLKDKPNEKVSIYRAVPKMQSNSEKIAGLEKDLANYMKRGRMPKNSDFDNKSDWYEWASNERDRLASLPEETIEPLSINHGDWVALDKKYAKEHGESALGGNYKILSKKVPARQLFTNGDSIREWGWDSRYAEGGEVDNGYAKGGEVDAAIEDYKQLLSGYPNAEKFFTGLKDAAYRSVPTTEQMRDPNFIIDNAGFGGIIKPKGGNWLDAYGKTPSRAAYKFERSVDPELAGYARAGMHLMPHEYNETVPVMAVNDWLQQKLAKYIKNEMGTPEDPVRRIAEEWPAKRDVLISQQQSKIPNLQELAAKYEEMGLPSEVIANRMANAQRETAGIQDKITEIEGYNPLHYTPREVRNLDDIESIKAKRAYEGYPEEGIAKTDLGKLWEHYADENITPIKVKNVSEMNVDKNPWLTKLNDEDKVYITDNMAGTGFDKLADELRKATRPDTDLPDFLRIDPAKLSRVSMPQAVEHVAKINAWREAEKLKKGRNAATVMHKEYPDQGLAWMQMKMPEPTLLEGHYLGEDRRGNPAVLDASGGEWASASTLEEALADYRIAERRDALQAALKFEGDTMGHCVGQYCDEVGGGKSNIYSLRDRRGEPHVTIETSKPADEYLYYNMLMDKLPYDEQDKLITDVREYNAANPHLGMKKSAINFMKDLYGPPKEKIVQIKGKQNAAPNEKYLPAVQDFVRSKDWSSVGDFENTGLTDLNRENSRLHPEFQNIAKEKFGRYATDDEIESLMDDFLQKNVNFAKGGSVQALHDKYEESDYGYGNRPDKTKKGLGYFGELERPDGTGVMTEYSIGVPINGEEMDVPTLIPTLTPDEIRLILHMQDGEDMPRSIVHKAIDHAHQRLSEGKPIFATEEDLYAHGGIVDVLHNDAIEQIMKAFMDSMEDEQEEEEPAAVSIQITTHSQPLKSGKIPTSIREAKHG